jgi:NAD(P)-dependent dehydrogenase (short-subunit alcohol dehydrogenase family)
MACVKKVWAAAARGRGGILDISSGAGIALIPGSATYTGAKHFVNAFTETLAMEMVDTGGTATQVVGIGLAELQTPLAYHCVCDQHTLYGQELLNVAIAQGAADVQPDSIINDFGGEADPLV